MDMDEAIVGYNALSTRSRVKIVQLLAKAGEEGMPSGEIAKKLKVPQNTMSTQLLLLGNARLIRQQRDGRSVIYRINRDAIKGLIEFLGEDCGGGRAKANTKAHA
jgi:ArsR family transcriptional regulator